MQKFKNTRELMEYAVSTHKQKTSFIIKKNKKYTKKSFVDLYEDIKNLTAVLVNRKLAGKPVALIGNNCYEWCVAFFGILGAGSICVPLDNRLPKEEVNRLLERSYAEAVIFTKNHTETMQNKEIPIKICVDGEGFESFYDVLKEGESINPTLPEIDPDKPAILMFTSGTTAESKGVILSQNNLLSNTKSLGTAVNFDRPLTYLAIIPMHHAFGCGAMVLFTAHGVTTVFPEGLRIAQALEEYKVSMLVCVPAILNLMYKKIIKEISAKGKTKTVEFGIKLSRILLKLGIDIRRKLFRDILEPLGGELKLIISGAAALDPKICAFFNDIGISLIQGYGLSETSPVVSAEKEGKQRYGSVGFPMPDVEVKIDNPDEKGIGEIIVKGENVMLGYFENDDATKEVLKNGWFYTGDMGYIDNDGYIFITGRKKNVLVLENGKNVFPEELEQLIEGVKGVKENLVFLKKVNGREIMCARIVYDTDIYESDEMAHSHIWEQIKALNQSLVTYKQIKKISLTTEPMEKTTTAKIKRNAELAKEV